MTYLQVDHEIIFLDLTVLNSWILLSSCGAKYTHRDFKLLLMRNLIEEAGNSQDRPTPRLVGRPCPGAKKMFCDSRVAITSTGQRNHQHNSTAVRVLLMAKGRAQSINAPDVMFRGISYKSKFVDHPLCE